MPVPLEDDAPDPAGSITCVRALAAGASMKNAALMAAQAATPRNAGAAPPEATVTRDLLRLMRRLIPLSTITGAQPALKRPAGTAARK